MKNREMITAYIALGSNLGERARQMGKAITSLRAVDGIEVTKISSFIETAAVGGPEHSPPFLNAVIAVRTTLTPEDLLARLLSAERKLGRVRSERWSPRTIDLDLLLYGDRVIEAPGITVPHPLMHERRFVLAPLAEIAPHVMHPILKRNATTLLIELDSH